MPTYEYRALDTNGRRRRGLLEADDPRAARRSLAKKGLFAERVCSLGAMPGSRRKGLIRPAFRAFVYRELSVLLRAGLTLERSLSMIGAMPEMAGGQRELAAVCDRIREGAGPADAFAEVAPLAPLESAALAAGERSGTLDAALDRLAGLLDSQIRTRNTLVTAMVYPAVVALLGVVVAVAMLGFMLPSFMKVWVEAGVELPWITRAVSSIGRGLGIALIPFFAAIALVLGVPRLRKGPGRAVVSRVRSVFERRGPWGRVSRAGAASRFARTLSLLLRGGVSAVDALPMAGQASGRSDMAEAVTELAVEVRHGLSLADAIRRVPDLASALGPWVEAGEATGDLAELLERAADREQEAWERGVERSLRLIEPAIILVLGGFVLLIALAILMPILSLHGI